MAKEQCSICGKMVGTTGRVRLGDGHCLCTDCMKLANIGSFTNTKSLTINDVAQRMQTDPTSIARQEQQAYSDQVALDKLGLDFTRYSFEDLQARNTKSAKEISASLAGSKLYSFGSLLSGDANQTFLMEMERAQVEQNNIMIRQNEEILRWLRAIYTQGMEK